MFVLSSSVSSVSLCSDIFIVQDFHSSAKRIYADFILIRKFLCLGFFSLFLTHHVSMYKDLGDFLVLLASNGFRVNSLGGRIKLSGNRDSLGSSLLTVSASFIVTAFLLFPDLAREANVISSGELTPCGLPEVRGHPVAFLR